MSICRIKVKNLITEDVITAPSVVTKETIDSSSQYKAVTTSKVNGAKNFTCDKVLIYMKECLTPKPQVAHRHTSKNLRICQEEAIFSS